MFFNVALFPVSLVITSPFFFPFSWQAKWIAVCVWAVSLCLFECVFVDIYCELIPALLISGIQMYGRTHEIRDGKRLWTFIHLYYLNTVEPLYSWNGRKLLFLTTEQTSKQTQWSAVLMFVHRTIGNVSVSHESTKVSQSLSINWVFSTDPCPSTLQSHPLLLCMSIIQRKSFS